MNQFALKEFVTRLLGAPAGTDEAQLAALAAPHEKQLAAAIARRTGHFLSAAARQALGVGEEATIEEVSVRIIELTTKAGTTDKLQERVEQLETTSIEKIVDQAIASFRITPAERADQIALAKRDRGLFDRLLAQRAANKPAGKVKTGTAPTDETLLDKQNKAIDAWLKDHPGGSAAAAISDLAKTQPALFSASRSVGEEE